MYPFIYFLALILYKRIITANKFLDGGRGRNYLGKLQIDLNLLVRIKNMAS